MDDTLLTWEGLGARHAFETRAGDLATLLPTPVLRLRQVHGSGVHVIDLDDSTAPYEAQIEHRPAGDALVTGRPDVTIAIATADCVPVLIHDPDRAVVAAAHAGWRGIAADVIGATVAAMASHFGSDPRSCRAAIGPFVGPASYRVGPEVLDGFDGAGLPRSLFTSPAGDANGRATWLCDLGAATSHQLCRAGIGRTAIWIANRCTLAESECFHSFRRDGEAAGRMASGICAG